MSTVTDERRAGYPAGGSRNAVHPPRSDSVTDSRPAGYPAGPRAVTCSVCGQDIPPDKNMLVLAVKITYKPADEQKRYLSTGAALCIACAKAVREQPYCSYVYPWLTHGARDTGRRRDDYLHRCVCGRTFYGAFARRYCSDECAELTRAARRDRRQDVPPRPCEQCHDLFTPPRSDGRYCTPACRQKAYRQRQNGGTP